MSVRSALGLGFGIVWLWGCGATVKRISAPDGSDAWRVDCAASVETDCKFEAERICPAGYTVLASDDRGMAVRCRPRSAPPPAAEEAPADDASATQTPTDDAAQPPPEPMMLPRPRHGLFARAALGWGSSQANETLTDGQRESLHGTGLAFDAALGTAVSPIIMLGGTFAYQHIPSPVLTYAGRDTTASGDGSISVAGFLIQAYASRTSGLHFGGLAGFGSLSAPDPYGLPATFRASGVGYGAEIGYHAPLGDLWHLGAKVRLLGAATSYGTLFRFEAQNTWAVALLGDVMSL